MRFSWCVSACTRADASAYVRTPSWTRLPVYSAHCRARRCLQQRIYAAPRPSQLWRLQDLQQGFTPLPNPSAAGPLPSLRRWKVTVHSCSQRSPCPPLFFTLFYPNISHSRAATRQERTSSRGSHPQRPPGSYSPASPRLFSVPEEKLRAFQVTEARRRPASSRLWFRVWALTAFGSKNTELFASFFPTLTMKRW